MRSPHPLPCLALALAAIATAQSPESFEGNCAEAEKSILRSTRTDNDLTGLTYAQAVNGRLVCTAALGLADSATRRSMQPTTLMRIGSISKPVTAMAIMKLWEAGKLSPDDTLLKFFPEATPTDVRWSRVTLKSLLQHSLGWDRALGGEPSQNSIAISRALNLRGPATTTDVARWIFSQNLHFEPGARYAYTGVSYTLLSIVVERASGLPYERYTRQEILEPLGIRTTMRVGRTLQEGRSSPEDMGRMEASYYVPASITSTASVFPYITAMVPRPYGEWYNEGLEGSGGWIASAPALVKLVDGIFGRPGRQPLLKPETLAAMSAKPRFTAANATTWIGYGWQYTPAGNALRIRFAGGLRGTMSELYYLDNGRSYAYITNTSGEANENAAGPISQSIFQAVASLPGVAGDLYSQSKYIDGPNTAPQIRAQKGVVHGASFEPGVTAGSWFTILGWNFAKTTRLWAEADFTNGPQLPAKLDGVEVRINGIPAPVYYISPTQINAQVPAITTPGTATLEVIVDGVKSDPEPIEIRRASPEFFRYNLGGKSFVAAIFTDASVVADPVLAPGLRAAKAGDTVQIFGTGFALAPSGTIITTVVPTPAVTIRIGGQSTTLTFAGLVATGLFQANVIVPNLPPGDHRVELSVDGVPNLTTGLLPIR